MTTCRYALLAACLFTLAAFFGALVFGGSHFPVLRPGRHLVVPTGPIDMGFIAPDSIARFHFDIRNAGTVALKIKKVFASCGCTVTKINRTTLYPGASAVVSVAFHSAGYWRGVHKEIYLVSNDSRKPFQQLSLFGYVRVGTRLDAKSINLGTGEFKQRLRSRAIHVMADAGMPEGAVRIAGDSYGLTVKTGPWRVIDGGEMQRCLLRVGTGPLESLPGSYVRRVIIAVGNKIRLPLRVLYTVRPVVSCNPSEVSVKGDASATVTLNYAGHHVRIGSISLALHYCTAKSIIAVPNGEEIRITRKRSLEELVGDTIDLLCVRYNFNHGARKETLDIPVVLSR